jgi:hypothetical protein
MGKASRQRRQKKDQERQRQRAAQGHGSHSPASTSPASHGDRSRPGPGTQAGYQGPSSREQVSALAGDALRALGRRDQRTYTRVVDQLTAERDPGWTGAVSRCLVEFLSLAVTAAWKAGWQPAELARHAGREASAAHASMTADMIAAEMRAYAAATVDPRWAAQVTATAPDGAWWGADAEYLAAWRRRAGEPDPTAPVATALETLHVLRHLQILESLLPAPGQQRARPAAMPASHSADERMLSRIRALLAKAESTEFAEEAEALSARAQELMAKYSIDHALLAARAGEKEEPSGRRIAVDNPYESPKTTLLNVVAEANRCRAIWSKDVGLVTVVGFPADLDAVELLFTSLLVQANTAMLRAGGKKDELGRSRTRAFRQSFLISYAIRIGERLAEAATHAEKEAAAEQEAIEEREGPAISGSTGTGLVPFLAARREAVNDAVDEMFGDRLTQGRAARVTDAEGWASGRAAADLASLHNRDAVAG